MALQTSPEQPAQVRTVARAVEQWIDRLGAIWVEGQVTQVSRRQGMQTVFLTLRDQLADVSVQVTAPRGLVDALPSPLVEGAVVVVQAKPSYWANRGSFSLAAREIRLAGVGELLARLEQRRRLLAAEGLFAEHHKRGLPFLPRQVGLVTADASAAERDVVEVARRRWPRVRIRTAYAAMQGVHAVREVVEALRRLDADPEVDVIVIARGGGSVEDLLPFSDETLVREVHAARTPVVSAIGHESDSPLLDLVADLRAATPTDAAKRVVPDVLEEAQRVDHALQRVRRALSQRLDAEQRALDHLRDRPVMADPRVGLRERSVEVDGLRDRARRALRHRLDRAGDDLEHRLARVRSLSPLSTLERGYAVVTVGGSPVTDPEAAPVGTVLDVHLARGRVAATVTVREESA